MSEDRAALVARVEQLAQHRDKFAKGRPDVLGHLAIAEAREEATILRDLLADHARLVQERDEAAERATVLELLCIHEKARADHLEQKRDEALEREKTAVGSSAQRLSLWQEAEARLSALLSGGYVQHQDGCELGRGMLPGVNTFKMENGKIRTYHKIDHDREFTERDPACTCGLDTLQTGRA